MPVCKTCADYCRIPTECYFCEHPNRLCINFRTPFNQKSPCEICYHPYMLDNYRLQHMCDCCRDKLDRQRKPIRTICKGSKSKNLVLKRMKTCLKPEPCPKPKPCPKPPTKCDKLDTIIDLLSCIKDQSITRTDIVEAINGADLEVNSITANSGKISELEI